MGVERYTTPLVPWVAAVRACETKARLDGLARAATALNVSTSAVSHPIKEWEESLGVRLLHGSTRVGGIRGTARNCWPRPALP